MQEQLENYLTSDDMKTCPECNTDVPSHLIGCWNCGHVFNENLVKLYTEQRGHPP